MVATVQIHNSPKTIISSDPFGGSRFAYTSRLLETRAQIKNTYRHLRNKIHQFQNF